MKCLLAEARKLTPYRVALLAVLVLTPLICGLRMVGSQGGRKEGKTRPVLIIPDSTTNAGEVVFKPDTDHDGMTDEDEANNGTDPNDPSDADGDNDGDGLTNGDEVAGGSNVNNGDSDGDGVSDGEEVRLGYDPNSAGNTPPPNATVVSIQLVPGSFNLSINTLLGPQSVQLKVVGTLNTGTTVDLTQSPDTTFESLDTNIVLVDPAGTVAGVANGSTTLRARNGAHEATASVTVTTFTPAALASLSIPGYANNVKVSGDTAYVAAGASGLHVLNVSNRAAPLIVSTLDTPGNANDVFVLGGLAYVADGAAGLRIINVSNPLAPSPVGSLDTPGTASDVVVEGGRAFVADGASGLQIIDVSNPSAPSLLGTAAATTASPGAKAMGVDVSGDIAVVAETNNDAGALVVVDVSDPSAPLVVGSLGLADEAKDVVARDGLAYVAAIQAGVQIVDFSTPGAPRLAGSFAAPTPGAFLPRDVAALGRYMLAAEHILTNAIPILDLTEPTAPRFRGVIDFSTFGRFGGTGIALDPQFVYRTGASGAGADNGTTGTTRLFIAQYQSLTDTGGLAPSVSINSPQNGQSVSEGSTVTLTATAVDDIQVTGVQFNVNGSDVGRPDTLAPYRFDYIVPAGVTTLNITAAATDLAGNRGVSAPVNVSVTPDTSPQVALDSPAEGTTLLGGQPVELRVTATDNGRVKRVDATANGVSLSPDYSAPYTLSYTLPESITSLSVAAVATDNRGRTTTVTRNFNVIPDPKTTVTGRVLDDIGRPAVGATVSLFGLFSTTTGSDGRFLMPGMPTSRGDIRAAVSAYVDGRKTAGTSALAAPVPNGTTALGDISLTALERIVFTDRRDSFNSEIYVMYADGSDQTRLTNNTAQEHSPLFSPDGTKIAFNSRRVPGGTDLGVYVMNSDGTEPRLVGSGFNFYWSPDGTKVAVLKNGQINVVNNDGANPRQVTTETQPISEFSWSNDGSRFAFTSINGGGRNLSVINTDGSGLVRLTTGSVSVSAPTISPDGSKVACHRETTQGGVTRRDLVAINADGSGLRVLSTETNNFFYDMVWYPDGTRFASINDSGIAGNIYVYSLDGTPPRRVTSNAAFDWGTALSPDTLHFAFASDDGLLTINADGTEQRLLSEISWDPDWGPALPPVTGARTTVVGQVVDEQGQPVAGATVTASNLYMTLYTALTDASGNYTITEVPATLGSITVSASATIDGEELSGVSAPTAPVPDGATSVGQIVLRGATFETRFGNVVDFLPVGADNASTAIDLPFSFRFYNGTFTRVFVGTNGYLTFNSGDSNATESATAFANGRPRIAPLFDDWVVVGQTATSGVFVNATLPGKVVFTWANVLAKANSGNPLQVEKATFQVTLYQDGRIQFGYRGVDTRGGLTGITPGGTPFRAPTDISSEPESIIGDNTTASFEQFRGATSDTPFDLDGFFITYTPQAGGGYRRLLQKSPQTTVRGVVQDANGNPLRGVRVLALDRYAVSNTDGSFEIFGVKATQGPLVVKATRLTPDGQLTQAQSAATLPVAGGVTDVGTLVPQAAGEAFESDLGQTVTLAPGAAGTQFPLPFPFRFYGAGAFGGALNSVYVNSAGYLALAQGCVRQDCADAYSTAATGVNEAAFINSRVPVIAPFYSALDAATGQVYVKSLPDRWVLTFQNVRRNAAATGGNTFQVVLQADGVIRFVYNGVSNTFAHVGVSPGGFAGLSEPIGSVDWSQNLIRPSDKAMPLVETFKGDFNGPTLDRPFDLDHSVMVFLPRAGGSYDVVRHRLPGHEPRRRIVFESSRDGAYEVFSMNDDGSDQVNLTNHPGDNYSASWSRDGSKIVFNTDRHYTDGVFESKIYVMNADGSDQRMLSDAQGDDFAPIWSPDGTKIAFTRFGDDSEIYVMNADGSNKVRLTNHPGADQFPAWSPDSSRLVFESWSVDFNPAVYVVNVNGTGLTRVSGADLQLGMSPSFSPDGTRVVFIGSPNSSSLPRVYVVNADGTGQTRVTAENLGAFEPTWSPDGTRIAYRVFASPLFTGEEIFTINPDGSNLTRLTNNTFSESSPRWSPDGTKIALFVYQDDTHGQVYVMDSNGANLRNISASRWDDFFDDWNIAP